MWIWPGEEAPADTAKIPHQEWIDNPGNYVSLHENLMDQILLNVLHANTIGTPDYASAPYRLDLKEGHYTLIREVVPTALSPVWGKTIGLEGCTTAARIATSEFLSPAVHRVSVTFYDSAQPLERREQFHIRTARILTPETNNSLHYFIVHGRDYLKKCADVEQQRRDQKARQ